jgi:AcrR family transcriptional regulator
LASALARFSGQGVDGTSIREIARGAGVSLAMVHHYFGSKDDLYTACIDSMYAELATLGAALESAFAAGNRPAELVDTAVRTGFRFARERHVETRLLLRAVVAAGELDEGRRNEVQIPFLERVPFLIGSLLGRRPGELRLTVQSIVMLTARYAISSPRELCLFAGASSPDEAALAVEDHLVHAAQTLLGIAGPPTRRMSDAN